MTLEETLAIAICNAFWETAEEPRRWSTSSEVQRQVFRNCAVRAVEAAREFKASGASLRGRPQEPPSPTHSPAGKEG